jgi:hypothetical protein
MASSVADDHENGDHEGDGEEEHDDDGTSNGSRAAPSTTTTTTTVGVETSKKKRKKKKRKPKQAKVNTTTAATTIPSSIAATPATVTTSTVSSISLASQTAAIAARLNAAGALKPLSNIAGFGDHAMGSGNVIPVASGRPLTLHDYRTVGLQPIPVSQLSPDTVVSMRENGFLPQKTSLPTTSSNDSKQTMDGNSSDNGSDEIAYIIEPTKWPKLHWFSEAISVAVTKEKGRHYLATRDIPQGYHLLQHLCY